MQPVDNFASFALIDSGNRRSFWSSGKQKPVEQPGRYLIAKRNFSTSHRLIRLCRQTDLAVRIRGCARASEGARQGDDREDITRMTLAGLPAAPGPKRAIFPGMGGVFPGKVRRAVSAPSPGAGMTRFRRDCGPAGALCARPGAKPAERAAHAPGRRLHPPERVPGARPCASRRAPGASTGTGPHRSHPAGTTGRPGGTWSVRPGRAEAPCATQGPGRFESMATQWQPFADAG